MYAYEFEVISPHNPCAPEKSAAFESIEARYSSLPCTPHPPPPPPTTTKTISNETRRTNNKTTHTHIQKNQTVHTCTPHIHANQ